MNLPLNPALAQPAMMKTIFAPFSWFLALSLALCLATIASAAPPTVNYLFPAGGQRGTEVSFTAAGDFSTWPSVKVWADRPGVTIEPLEEKGKFKATIAADAPPGPVWLRFYNDEGAAALRPFLVGNLPEIEEAEPNNAPGQGQAVSLPTIVNGKLTGGDVDGFVVPLKPGDTLVASLQGHTLLGSPMDAVLQICELAERRGRKEAFVLEQNHDAIGYDPQAAFKAEREGEYLVRVFAYAAEPNANIGFAGGDEYVYRLTLTTGGLIDHALPMSTPKDAATEVRLFGINLPDDGIPATAAPLAESSSATAWHEQHAGSARLLASELPAVVANASSSLSEPQEVPLPSIVSGRLDREREGHVFAFNAEKGKPLRATCQARALGSPLQASLKITDEAGKLLVKQEANAPRNDPALVFTPPESGRYFLSIADQHGRGDLRLVYRLTLENSPDFSLSLAAGEFVLPADAPLEVPLTIDRRDGFAEAIEIKAANLPEGITAEAAVSQPTGDTAKAVKLILKRADAATAWSGPIRIVGTSGGEMPRERTATFPVALPLAPPQEAIWIAMPGAK
jgi:hypothetical protein